MPKLGYRFVVRVTHSDETTRFDTEEVVIEEQIIQHLRGEETITIDRTKATVDKLNETAVDDRKTVNLLLQNNAPSNRSLPFSNFVLIGVAILGFLVSGFAFYTTYFKAETAQRTAIGIS